MVTNLDQLQGAWAITTTAIAAYQDLRVVISGTTTTWGDPQYAAETLDCSRGDMGIVLNTHTLVAVDGSRARWRDTATGAVVVWTRAN